MFNTSAWRPFHSNPDPVVTVPHPLRLTFMWGRNTWWLSYHCKGILDHSSLWRCFSSLRFAGTAFLRSHHSIEIWTLTRWLQQWFSPPIFSHFVAGLLPYLGSFFRQMSSILTVEYIQKRIRLTTGLEGPVATKPTQIIIPPPAWPWHLVRCLVFTVHYGQTFPLWSRLSKALWSWSDCLFRCNFTNQTQEVFF